MFYFGKPWIFGAIFVHCLIDGCSDSFKDGLWCLKQVLATESFLKTMRNALHFISEALFRRFFIHVDKRLNIKINDVINWKNYNTHIAQYSRSKGSQKKKFLQLTEYNVRNIFSWKIIHKTWWRSKFFKLKSFSKKLKISISLCQQSKFYTVCF